MDSVFLEEYEMREVDALKRNIPLSDRVGKLTPPIFNLIGENSSFWSQIALSGTVIFPLYPVSSDFFERTWGIKLSELSDLVHFVKDTKKIQFVLTAHPKFYQGFDYLDPILEKFNPPLYASNLNIYDQKLAEYRTAYFDEFNKLISSSRLWRNQSASVSGQQIVDTHIKSYILLRYYGLDEIADNFIKIFSIDPNLSHIYLAMVEHMILYPIGDSLKGNLSINFDTVQKAKTMGINPQMSSNNISFPEVGSFLTRKCTYCPENLDACKILISDYKDNDLYTVNAALNKAIVDRNDALIIQKKNDVGEILDTVWNDNTIKRNTIACSYGIEVMSGTIGYCIGGATGLFGSIGLSLLDKTKSNFIDQFSELIAKKIAIPYMAAIYDFKKKYRKET